MCSSCVLGKGCRQKSALQEIYEAQLEGYMESFHISEDYQDRLLEEHRKLEHLSFLPSLFFLTEVGNKA